MFREYIIDWFLFAIILLWMSYLAVSVIYFDRDIDDTSTLKEFEVTTAKPIYQQPIGDEAEPDILIIYEAEVDDVKVYPSVIKEAK